MRSETRDEGQAAQGRRNMATGLVLAFLALAVYAVVFLKLFVAQ